MTSYLSQAVLRLQPSATVAITQRAQEMVRAGNDVISLSAGQSDFETPQYIKDAAIKAINDGKTRYTHVEGVPELREAIANKFKRDNNLIVSSADCIVSTGGKQIIFNAFLATLNPGDEVVIPVPYWVSYPEVVNLCGATPIFALSDRSSNFKLSPDALDEALTERTKWLILNNPSNPTGANYTASELEDLAGVLRKYPDVLVLTDDIYETLVYSTDGFVTIAQVAPDIQSRVLTLNGVSKSHAMTGWRIGYGAGPSKLISAMKKLQSQSTTNACSIAQWAALEAIETRNPNQDLWKKTFQKRRDLVVAGLNNIDGLQCLTPDGAFYVFPECKDLYGSITPAGTNIRSDKDFVVALLEEAGLGAVHGSAFGLGGYFRLSYAASDQTLSDAIQRITNFCRALR